MRSFLVALQLLSRVPVRLAAPPAAADQARAAGWYPIVGLLIGAAAAIAYSSCAYARLAALGPLAALGTAVLLTGALHEDGLADTCDGLFGGSDRARRLEIMRDSRVGTYGVVGLLLVLGVQLKALALVPAARAPLLILAAHAFARAAVLPLARLPYARPEGGLARGLAGGVSWSTIAVALALGTAAAATLGWHFMLSALACGALLVAYAAYRCARDLGGVTGDTLGATIKMIEVGCYLVGAVSLR